MASKTVGTTVDAMDEADDERITTPVSDDGPGGYGTDDDSNADTDTNDETTGVSSGNYASVPTSIHTREHTPPPPTPTPLAEVAPITIQKRPRGRPRKDGTTPPVVVQVRPIPSGPHILYHSDKIDPSARPESFFAWFHKLDPDFRKRCKTFLYRNWPYGRYIRKHAKTGTLKPTRQIDKEFRMFRSTTDIIKQWGSGSYTIMVRDSAITTGPAIAECYIKDLHNDDYPPVIHNLEEWLDKDYPANKSFVEGMRARGIKLPGDTGYDKAKSEEEGNDEMSVMQRIGEKVVEKVLDGGMNNNQQQQGQSQFQGQFQRPRVVTRPINRDKGSPVKELAEAMKVMHSMQPRQQDPMELALKLITVLRPSEPSGDTKLAEAVVKSLEKQGEQISRLVESTVHKTEASAAAAIPKTRTELLQELVDERKLMRELANDGKEDKDDDDDDGKGGVLQPAALAVAKATGVGAWVNEQTMPLIMMGLGMVGNIVHNVAVAATRSGNPEAPPAPTMAGQIPGMPAPNGHAAAFHPHSIPGPPTNSPSPMSAMGGGGSGVGTPTTPPQYQPVAQPASTFTGVPVEQMTDEDRQVASMILQMEQPLVRHMQSGQTGVDYAAVFIGWFDRMTYERLVLNSKEDIIGAMVKFSPVLAQAYQNVPTMFEKFIEDFRAAGPILDEDDSGGDGGEGDMDANADANSTASTTESKPGVITRIPKKRDVN